MSRFGRLLTLAGLFLVAAVAIEIPDATTDPPIPPQRSAAATATPPALTPAQTNRQDRVGARHRLREVLAFDGRPLLSLLPIELAGVRIEIAGLAVDRRRTIVSVSAGPRGRDYAETLYRR